MKLEIIIPISMALFLTTAIGRSQTTFFSDNFSNGSTTNKLSVPGGTPTASSTSYDVASTKNTISACSINPNDLRLSLAAATSSGFWDAQALFATNAISLNAVNDYVDVAITFTNTMGTVLGPSASTTSAIWLGLFNSGSSYLVQTNWPVPGGALANSGLTANSGSPFATGNCALWQGYVGQMLTGTGSKLITRPLQNGASTTSANQELLGSGVGSGAFSNPTGTSLSNSGGTTGPASTAILTNVAYTIDLRITLSGSAVLTVSNALYQGTSTAGTMVWSEISTNASGSTFLTTAFDGLGFGLRASGSTPSTVAPEMDVSQILITGQSSPPTLPTILSQPVPVVVATNGYGQFAVTATGDNLKYQWYRNGAAITNGGDLAGATTPTLAISPAQQSDVFSGANGYYCIITGAGNLSTNTVTNSLALVPATNLVWAGNAGNGNWDVQTTVNWTDTNGNAAVFTGGDPVVFSDAANPILKNVAVIGNVSPASMYVSTATEFSFGGSGSIVGPATVTLDGDANAPSSEVVINSANNLYTGGTILTNGIYVQLANYGGIGSGPLTLNNPSGDLEVVPTGSDNTGIQGQVNVNDNGTILIDGEGSFGLVFLNNIAGVSGKTLTLSPLNTPTNSVRVRVYGQSMAYNANLNLSDPNILLASYETSGSEIYNGVISGPGAFMQKGVVSYLNGPNTYSGGTTPAQGAIGLGISSVGTWPSITSGPLGTGALLLAPDSTSSTTGTGIIFASSNSITLGNAIQYVSGTNNLSVEAGGSTNLTLAGPFTLYGNDHSVMTSFPTRTLIVTNTGLTIVTGQIQDGGSNYNFNLTGSGFTLFNATEAYGGITTNNGGTLLVNGQVGPGAVVVLTNAATTGGTNALAVLGGSGTITGPVSIQSGGTLTSGSQTTAGTQNIGTLTVNNTVTFLGGSKALVLVNKTANTHSLVNVSGTITYNGTLVATNISGSPVVGDHFTVFSAGTVSGNFTNIVGTPGPGLAWSFSPASGVLSVVTGVTGFTIPPGITNFALVNGTNIVISGTNGQAGALYYLLTSTNLLLPKSQWTPVGTNTAAGANFSFTVTNAATHGTQFYLFSSQP
jgi:hypothetical protein